MIDIEKFICSLLADHPEGVTVRNDIHRALKDQGLEYKNGKIVKIEQHHVWSEEDEEMYKKVETAIDSYYAPFSRDAEEMSEWFKNLKNRVQPQPKQEWSEDDKGNLLDVKCIIDEVWHKEETEYSSEELESLWHWLDNIWQRVEYPQVAWNPSDEQLEALSNALSLTKSCGEESSYDLRTLYEQLKKLRKQ